MTNFVPKGTVSEWRMLYELLSAKDFGELATFEEMDEALGRDFRANRSPLDRARRELQMDRKTLITERGHGYRIAQAREHADNAVTHHRRARRQLGRAKSEVSSADRNRLTTDEATRADSIEQCLAGQIEKTKRLEQRVARVEVKAGATAERVSELELSHKADREDVTAELAEVRAELATLRKGDTDS